MLESFVTKKSFRSSRDTGSVPILLITVPAAILAKVNELSILKPACNATAIEEITESPAPETSNICLGDTAGNLF